METIARLAGFLTEKRRGSMASRLAFEVDMRSNSRPEQLSSPNLTRIRRIPVLDVFGERKCLQTPQYDSSMAQREIQHLLEGMRFTGLTDILTRSSARKEAPPQSTIVQQQEEVQAVPSRRPQKRNGRSQSLEEAILSLMTPREGNDSASTSGSQKPEPGMMLQPPARSPVQMQGPFLSINEIRKALSTQNWARSAEPNAFHETKLERWASSASTLSKELNSSPLRSNDDPLGIGITEDSSKSPPSTATNPNLNGEEDTESAPPRQAQSFLSQLLNSTEPPQPLLGISPHVRTWHPGTGPYPCTICGMRFPTSQAVRGHRNAHRQLKKSNQQLEDKSKKRKVEIAERGSHQPSSGDWSDGIKSQEYVLEKKKSQSQNGIMGLLSSLAMAEHTDKGMEMTSQLSAVDEVLLQQLLGKVLADDQLVDTVALANQEERTGQALTQSEIESKIAFLLARGAQGASALDLNLKLSS